MSVNIDFPEDAPVRRTFPSRVPFIDAIKAVGKANPLAFVALLQDAVLNGTMPLPEGQHQVVPPAVRADLLKLVLAYLHGTPAQTHIISARIDDAPEKPWDPTRITEAEFREVYNLNMKALGEAGEVLETPEEMAEKEASK